MATLTVTGADTDYRDGSPAIPASTDAIDFSTSGATTARFNSSQFGGTGISNTVAITGDANFNSIRVDTPGDTFFSAAGWTFSNWSVGDGVSFFGTVDAETIVGSVQSNSFRGGGGADVLTGANQSDLFSYISSADAEVGEILDGNGGIDQILVTNSNIDLSLVLIFDIEQLSILDGSTSLAGQQIGSGGINEVIGTAGNSATLTVNDNDADLSGVTFTNWDVALHSIVVNGTGGADDLTGSSQNDTITGGLGADTLEGGNGDDTFVYNAFAEFATGETINGGAGSGDTLRINVGQGFTLNVSGAGVLTGVEKVVFAQGGTLRVSGENVGAAAGLINAVTGSAGENELVSFDSNVNLSALSFANWTVGEDTIFFGGTAGSDTLVGSSQNDQFSLSPGGIDSVSGGGGNDIFFVNTTAFVAGASIDGGGGADEISTAGADFSVGTVVGVERLTFFDQFIGTAVSITVSGTHVRAGAITTVDGGNFVDTLTVKGASVDLTGVTFTQWTAGVDRIVINGDPGVDSVLIGSNLIDEISGGAGDDTIDGGLGNDLLNGGLGNDTYVMGAENDAVTDAGGIDTITSTVSRSLLGFDSIENLTLLGTAIDGTGNALANVITGNAGANTLDGGDGADAILGVGGNDRLIGGLGADQFTGGTGADIFAFVTLADSGKKASARDTILDFTAEDFIDFSAIDAKKGGKNNKFKFIGKDAFDGKKGEIRYQKKNGDVVVSGDVNGDGKADFSILLDSLSKVGKADFVL